MAVVAASVEFQLEQFSPFSIYQSPRHFLPSFKSISPSVQEKKFKLDFKNGLL